MEGTIPNSGICVMICNIKVIPLSMYARQVKKAQCMIYNKLTRYKNAQRIPDVKVKNH
jgi:hypothetical protein